MNRESLRYFPSILLAGLILLLVFVAMQAIYDLREILAVIFLGIIVGLAMSPLAERLERWRVPRVASVLAVYAVVLGAISLVLWFAIPSLARQTRGLIDNLDELREEYEDLADDSPLPPLQEVGDFVQGQLGGVLADVASQAFLVVSVLVYLFVIFVIGLLFTVTKDSMRSLLLGLVDDNMRARTEEVLDTLGARIRRFVLGEILTMTFIGVMVYVGLLVIGVPFPLVLAAWAFLTEILPIVGPWLAYIPAVIVALVDGGIWPAVAVSVFYLAVQQIESYVIVPLVQGKSTKLPAMLIIIAIMVGGVLMGVLGALVALPTAIILHTLFFMVLVPWRHAQIERRRARRLEAAGLHGRDSAMTLD